MDITSEDQSHGLWAGLNRMKNQFWESISIPSNCSTLLQGNSENTLSVALIGRSAIPLRAVVLGAILSFCFRPLLLPFSPWHLYFLLGFYVHAFEGNYGSFLCYITERHVTASHLIGETTPLRVDTSWWFVCQCRGLFAIKWGKMHISENLKWKMCNLTDVWLHFCLLKIESKTLQSSVLQGWSVVRVFTESGVGGAWAAITCDVSCVCLLCDLPVCLCPETDHGVHVCSVGDMLSDCWCFHRACKKNMQSTKNMKHIHCVSQLMVHKTINCHR